MPESLSQPRRLTAKDFRSGAEPRWCPGCGDYAILAAMQGFLPELGVPKERIVFVSGIGCSSRFPYYLNTYGIHSIHGRAPAIATGLAVSRPDLSVWVITGDGDALSIGGNHLIHALRRNVNLKILLFNNRIYGLTKGQYSPTSEFGKITKSTPAGSIDAPFNPVSLALGAEATFVARTIDSDRKHLQGVLRAAAEHPGSAFVEIYQNCNIFNDGAFEILKNPETRDDALIQLEHGRPITFGRPRPAAPAPATAPAPAAPASPVPASPVPAPAVPAPVNGSNGSNGGKVTGGGAAAPNGDEPPGEWAVVPAAGGFGLSVARTDAVPHDEIVVHDATVAEPAYAFALSRLHGPDLRHTPVGVFRSVHRPTYNGLVQQQVAMARESVIGTPEEELESLLNGGDTWTVL